MMDGISGIQIPIGSHDCEKDCSIKSDEVSTKERLYLTVEPLKSPESPDNRPASVHRHWFQFHLLIHKFKEENLFILLF